MRLANAMSERVNQLVAANGQVGERLLLMAGLLLADDLHSARKAAAQSATESAAEAGEGDADKVDAVQQAYEYVADVFEQLSERLEAVADNLEGGEDSTDA